MEKRYCVIDVGSNSIRLLLAKSDGTQIYDTHKKLITTRLGRGLAKDDKLDEKSINDSIEAIENFLAIAKQVKTDEIYAFATSAVREALNQNELLDRCRERFNLEIDVLSGIKEAEMAYAGCAPRKGAAHVIDIGGGSTELLAGYDGEIILACSISFGAVRAKEMFEDSAPGHIDARRYFRTCQAQIVEKKKSGYSSTSAVTAKQALKKIRNTDGLLYGVGGTITTISALSAGLITHYDPNVINGYLLRHAEARRILHELGGQTIERRASIPILKDRADTICFGGAILLECMDAMNIKALRCSESDNLEGYLFKKLNQA